MTAPTLLDFVRGLDPFERAHIIAIWIDGMCAKGYKVRCAVHLYRVIDSAEGPYAAMPYFDERGRVTLKAEASGQHPDIEGAITWQIPAWDQFLELVRSQEAREWLGTMYANEHTRLDVDGTLVDTDAGRVWHIAMHGRQGSPERETWRASVKHDAWV